MTVLFISHNMHGFYFFTALSRTCNALLNTIGGTGYLCLSLNDTKSKFSILLLSVIYITYVFLKVLFKKLVKKIFLYFYFTVFILHY